VHLRYYQYEVTFGLYMMSPAEKAVLHTIAFSILGFLLYALYIWLGPFVILSVCKFIYYLTGSNMRTPEPCHQ